MKRFVTLFLWMDTFAAQHVQNSLFQLESCIQLKKPGNNAVPYPLTDNGKGNLFTNISDFPIQIKNEKIETDSHLIIKVTLLAKQEVYFNFQQTCVLPVKHANSQFYMPGFWYRKNLRSPKEAPSFHTSDSWTVREDRLSTPLTGIFDDTTGEHYTVLRKDKIMHDAVTVHTHGDVILSGKTDIGYTGFQNVDGNAALVFGFPYFESPTSYIRKLTLTPSVKAFQKMEKGETRILTWEIRRSKSNNFSDFVADVWKYTFDVFKPKPLKNTLSAVKAKETLTNFFVESYVETPDLNYFSGVHLRTDDAKNTGVAEVGFVGRVLLNAFNALEYGETENRPDLIEKANCIFDSYLKNGFTSHGFFREYVDYTNHLEEDTYSIRRQSEGALAILNYLKYEKNKGRYHTEWENRITILLNNFLKLQLKDGSFPRKFNNNFEVVDSSGGSTPSATLPLTMASVYFKSKLYLDAAKATGVYLEKELITKADYFSSTLDANCEDKEASLYAATAMYYLAMITTGDEKQQYIDYSVKAAYFCLSWYYLWDVPFAPGQLLGDVKFKSRGWGNVSVENNHIDAFIFEFATILDWLAVEREEPRFSAFSSVIKSTLLQLMPMPENMNDIGKVGFYPEVVQHTSWDYGNNGKGFYNDIFAPGWVVASLWQMLSPNRVNDFFNPLPTFKQENLKRDLPTRPPFRSRIKKVGVSTLSEISRFIF